MTRPTLTTFTQPSRVAVLHHVIAAILALGSLSAADWPGWRGPERTGAAPAESALRDTFGPGKELAPAWEFTVPTPGGKTPNYACPIITGGRVIQRVSNGTEDLVVAVDLETGKEAWTFRVAGGKAKYAAPNTPCVVDGKLFFIGSQGSAFCLNAANGTEVWTTPLNSKGGTFTSSPLVAAGLMVVCDGAVVALDAMSGAKRWENKDVKCGHTSPALWRGTAASRLIVGAGKDVLAALDPATGTKVYELPGGINSSPVISGDLLATTFHQGGFNLYRLAADKAERVSTMPLDTDDNQSGSPALVAGKAYGFDAKKGYCLDTATGKPVWEVAVGGKTSSPIVVGNRLLILSGKNLNLVDAETGKVLSTTAITSVGHSSPAYADGCLVVNANTVVRCYDLRSR